MKKTKVCPGFCHADCVNGNCPNAQYEAADEMYGGGLADDMGLERISCSQCSCHTGNCEDCIFEGTEHCVKNESK